MMATSSESGKNWFGTSMEDIYCGHGPWAFEIPPVTASRDHAVLYELPITLDSPPKPYCSVQDHYWDDDYVWMPYSPKNLFPVENENGEKTPKESWKIIQESLLQPIHSSRELEVVISSYNTGLPKFLALHHFFENILEEDEIRQFFEILLPRIIELALGLPDILPGNIPLLKQGCSKSISLSQLQIASLLANAFLCTFPWREDSVFSYPGIDFARLFAAHSRPEYQQAVAEKLKCVCHYFRRVTTKKPVGVVTFERKHFSKSQLPRWDRLKNKLSNTRIHVSSIGAIEDEGCGLLQVDFANKNVGGGVLDFGCVQEEIRFIVYPELIVSRLFTEQLGPTEALVVTGAERFSNYTGYGDSFMWSENCSDTTPHDSSGRRRTSIVAIDAIYFTKPAEQYSTSNVFREINKAYAGFHSRFESLLPPVATGNWGCGAFRGDPNLKSLIQLMACSAAKRDMVYFTFGDSQLCNSIHEIYIFLATNQVTISQLWRYLCQFANAKVKSEHLFSYIQQAHFDSKHQLCIKDFFCFNKKKSEKRSPSTSTHSTNNDVDVVD
ncbi:hypothetical protein ILUMI_01181 [Ignelater luminosus]|uniref:poly(ADP-ribose) glycohydrolase n=1 Tax=Ignelater luminosus TaxID=2038154 RepID=A0A8K0DK70_IGNLU|nr:hypothetical protein ILUMI_01181 [Ignelater luminosus]